MKKYVFTSCQLVLSFKKKTIWSRTQLHSPNPSPSTDVLFLSRELSAQQVEQTVNSWAGVDLSQLSLHPRSISSQREVLKADFSS